METVLVSTLWLRGNSHRVTSNVLWVAELIAQSGLTGRSRRMAAQLVTLLAVLLGAVSSYLASTLSERARHRRDVERHWREQRLEAYVDYINDVKQMRVTARRIAAGAGFEINAPALSREEGLPLLAEIESQRSISGERVALMSDEATIMAQRELNRTVWKLEWYARGLLDDTDIDGWNQAERECKAAMHAFHDCVRRTLGVPGRRVPREDPSGLERPIGPAE
jgi:hypothetical protein